MIVTLSTTLRWEWIPVAELLREINEDVSRSTRQELPVAQ